MIVLRHKDLLMPLLLSPIDGVTPMKQIKRDGIEIDICPVSGGCWLDRGELEKLLMAVQNAVDEDRSHYNGYRQQQPQASAWHPASGQGYRRYDDDDYEKYHHKQYGKKSKLKSLFDLFD
jgi:uncharacterized protein